MSSVPAELIENYLVRPGIGRGLRRKAVRWKYYDAQFNGGRERGYAWLKQGAVRGFIGWIPVTLATPAGDQDMIWTCDWSVDEPESNPGVGVRLLSKVRKSHGFVGGVGGSDDTHALVPQMATRSMRGAAATLRRPLRSAALLEKAEKKLPFGVKLSRTALGRLRLPRRRRPGSLPVSTHSPGVDAEALAPLFDRPAEEHCIVRHDAAYLAWFGRNPNAECHSLHLRSEAHAAAGLLWRLRDDPARWRLVLRHTAGGEAVLEALIADALRWLATTPATIVSTVIASHDTAAMQLLRRHGFLEAGQRLPLYIPERHAADFCPAGFAQMSYLDTDQAFIPD